MVSSLLWVDKSNVIDATTSSKGSSILSNLTVLLEQYSPQLRLHMVTSDKSQQLDLKKLIMN